ncbi:uncharacterized protein [Palaemon carinicauda]|uniref:uncharacterized protein n=1 Tax=Palaemon carinicauda TaxID=392227 RepID=UPI0035B6294F
MGIDFSGKQLPQMVSSKSIRATNLLSSKIALAYHQMQYNFCTESDDFKLSEAQRQSYQQLTKEGKDSAEKMDCNGVPIRVLQSKEEEKREQEENMTKEIRDTLEFLKDGRALHHNRIFIISTSEYCRTERGSVPAELSVLCFTFENGIEREHHKILKANIPACYAYTAREESARTHCLLPDNLGMTDDTDTEEVLHELVQFLLKDLESLPPVFTLEEHRRTTEEVLFAISGGFALFFAIPKLLPTIRNQILNIG